MTDSKQPRHFLTLLDLDPSELRRLVDRASELKRMHRAGERPQGIVQADEQGFACHDVKCRCRELRSRGCECVTLLPDNIPARISPSKLGIGWGRLVQ